MTAIETPLTARTSWLRVPRSRGAISGVLLLLLGAWGALVPFFGPSFNFGFSPDQTWTWTSTRGWLEVLPGGATALGGLLLLLSANRILASLGGWLAAAGGAWFLVGPSLAVLLHISAVGTPITTRPGIQSLEWLALFYALGGLILFVAAAGIGRLTIRSVGDLHAAQPPNHAPAATFDETPRGQEPKDRLAGPKGG